MESSDSGLEIYNILFFNQLMFREVNILLDLPNNESNCTITEIEGVKESKEVVGVNAKRVEKLSIFLICTLSNSVRTFKG
jgi:hypothetical protein